MSHQRCEDGYVFSCDWCGRAVIKRSATRPVGWIQGRYSHQDFCCIRCKKEYEAACPNTGGCFITTATCQSRNLPDDCHELTALRKFRDTFMKTDGNMKVEVEEYYKIAPVICENINKQENSSEIYEQIYQKWLKDAVLACDNNETEKAYNIYKDMVLELKDLYL